MKMGTIERIQHLNAVATFLFCVLYFFLQYSYGCVTYRLFAWAGSLPLLYFANLITYRGMSEEDIKNGKKAGIFGSWCLVFFFLGMRWSNNLLKFAAIISFILLIVAAVYVSKSKKRASLWVILKLEADLVNLERSQIWQIEAGLKELYRLCSM